MIESARDFLYAVTALTSLLALTTVIRRPRWLRGTAWRARHPQ